MKTVRALLPAEALVLFNDKPLGMINDIQISETVDDTGKRVTRVMIKKVVSTDESALDEIRFDLQAFEITNQEHECGFRFINPKFKGLSVGVNASDTMIYALVQIDADYMHFFAYDPLEEDVNKLIDVIKTNQAKQAPAKPSKKKTKKIK